MPLTGYDEYRSRNTRAQRSRWQARAALFVLAVAALTLPAAASAKPPKPPKPINYKVLVVTAGSKTSALNQAGVNAIKTIGQDGGTKADPNPTFSVDLAQTANEINGKFTARNLERFRAVIFLDTAGATLLTNAQRSAFEEYFHLGGGFLAIGSAIETEPAWQFFTDILGTRASGNAGAQTATIKVADRVHDATKSLPFYWDSTDAFYNYTTDVRGVSHVLATVVEDPFGPQPQGQVLDGIAGGTMGADHPVSWCKDYRGGRSFYTGLGNTPSSFGDANLRAHLTGAIDWAAGVTDPVYSDCGATVLANYQQVKISGPPNLGEPIGFDQLPDGRIVQTARTGTVQLHNPETGTTQVLANFADPSLPLTQRLYTSSEDGLYGPAVDNDFATNHWVYLYYSPQTVTDVKLSDGSIVTQTTPNTTPPNAAPSVSAWDPYIGYFQLSRFKFVDDAPGVPAHLDLTSEQQILRVSNNRQECCHVAGDIDFDTHNNLWLVTGNDTPPGGIDANGFGPFEDQLLDEQQTVRVTNATGGTFTLSFSGQTTDPLPFNANAGQIDQALEALPGIGANNIQTSGGPVSTANVNVFFRRALQQSDQPQLTADGSGLTGSTPPSVTTATAAEGGWFQRPTGDARRSTLNTNDLRGKVLRIHVKDSDIGPGDANKPDLGAGGAYTIPAGNLFPLVGGQPPDKTRPEVYAMGFQNPFRLQVDENDVAYVSDYSPDANTPQRSRGPAGVGRYLIIRHPANYGFPICVSKTLPYYRWSFREFAPGTTTVGTPLDNPPQPFDCAGATIPNDSRWNLLGGPGNEPGLHDLPPITDPDVWYSYRDNNGAAPLGTPCFGYYATTPGPIAPGSTTECPRLFPELFPGGVGPHGMAKYHYDPANPNPKKFPPYYDNSVILGEFMQDTLRELKTDQQDRVFKINQFLPCGQANVANPAFTFECDNPMDMQWGADGDFYLLTYGDGFFNANPDAGLYKWEYVKGRRAPVVVLSVDRTDGPLPLTVNFSSVGSSDPDPGDSISFDWDFGDGSPHSMDPNPSHTYTVRGRYTAQLTVTDSSGKSSVATTIITAGNTSPTVTIDTPVAGGTFDFGDDIPFSVTVTDPEDGPIACSEVQVTFVLGHDTHGHAEASTTGCSGVLPTDAGDVSHGGNVFGVISATYTDHGVGHDNVQTLTTTGQQQIRQKHQEVEFVVNQSGTNTATNNDGGPGLHRGSLAAGDWIQLNGPFNLLNISSISFRVADASAGRTAGSPLAAIEIHQDSVAGPIVGTSNLVSTGGTATWTTQTFPVQLAGTHELFLVFRQVTGGATGGNLFNLNWAEFNGPGIGT
jgi:PKD repeat protein